jgi:hypothetical protein
MVGVGILFIVRVGILFIVGAGMFSLWELAARLQELPG